jgi:hypothetical protein
MAVKRTISFVNLDGVAVDQDWYFALDEADASEMDLAFKKDLPKYLAEIQENEDGKELLHVMREILFASAGKREGNLLIKDASTRRQFKFGGAYKQLFSELLESDDGGMPFFLSIMPAKVQAQVAAEAGKTYSKEDMLGMTEDEFKKVFGTDETKYTQEQLLVAFHHRNRPPAAA